MAQPVADGGKQLQQQRVGSLPSRIPYPSPPSLAPHSRPPIRPLLLVDVGNICDHPSALGR